MCKGVREQIEFSLWKVTNFFFSSLHFKMCFYLLAKRPGDDSVGGEIKKPRVEVCIN